MEDDTSSSAMFVIVGNSYSGLAFDHLLEIIVEPILHNARDSADSVGGLLLLSCQRKHGKTSPLRVPLTHCGTGACVPREMFDVRLGQNCWLVGVSY